MAGQADPWLGTGLRCDVAGVELVSASRGSLSGARLRWSLAEAGVGCLAVPLCEGGWAAGTGGWQRVAVRLRCSRCGAQAEDLS